MELNQNVFNTTYQVRNKDVELLGEYFDVVPDGNLYTLDDYPIFAVRMRPMGIKRIMEMYEKKYKFQTKVLTYKINSDQYTLYSDNARQMYSTQADEILKYFDFNSCENNSFKGVIMVVVNDTRNSLYLRNTRRKKKSYFFGCVFFAKYLFWLYNWRRFLL